MTQIAINSVTVLGAGTMGAQIALHCANAGIPALLLDLTADVAKQGLEKARKLKPDPQFTPDAYKLVTTGGFDTHLDLIAKTDWIMEAVVERLDIKQQLLAKVDEKRRPGSIVSSNTSGIPIAAIAEGRSEDFRKHWLGTHFFNPPRYLRLLEIIPTADTDPAVVAAMTRFGDHVLGKGVVIAKDTPNFIANHVGLYGVARTLDVLASGKYTIEEIDAITGPALGRPGSATFRTMDIAGIDVLAHVLRNLSERLATDADRKAFAVPPLVEQLIAKGALGEKTGKGFYERRKSAAGETEIWTLDPATLEYRQKQSARIGSIEAGKSIDDVGERVRMLFNSKDKAGEFLRATLAPTLVYTARVTPDIAHSIDDVDRAMRWGFGWDLGPFELIDAIGIKDVLAAAARHACHGRRRAAADRQPPRERADAIPRRPRQAGRAGSADPPDGKRTEPRHQEERGREPRRSRRRRDRRRIPLEDERDRRRHGPDAAGRRERSRQERPGAGDRQRRAELLRRRQPDAGPARSAGRQLGRDRHDDSRVPAARRWRCATARCRSSRRPPVSRLAAAPRFRCTAIACRRPRKPTWASSKSASA